MHKTIPPKHSATLLLICKAIILFLVALFFTLGFHTIPSNPVIFSWTRCCNQPYLLFSVIALSYSFLQTSLRCPPIQQQKQLMEKECTYTRGADGETGREREGGRKRDVKEQRRASEREPCRSRRAEAGGEPAVLYAGEEESVKSSQSCCQCNTLVPCVSTASASSCKVLVWAH